MSRKCYTGIGSRETPEQILKLMHKIATKLCGDGYKLRSGAAGGADSAFQAGLGMLTEDWERNAAMEIFIPWEGFSGYTSDMPGIHCIKGAMKAKAAKIAESLHPAWERCSQGAKALHTRNIFQLLGPDLKSPSKFVICYAQPAGTEGHVKGGTATAVRLALTHSIPVFNLHLSEHKQRLEEFISV